MYIYYNQDQLILPMDLEILIPKHHLCWVVDLAVEKMDPALFVSLYPGGGRPAYHPKMMWKAILYAYANRIYSSRQIAKQLKENIYFMWLSGHQTPDFRTINRISVGTDEGRPYEKRPAQTGVQCVDWDREPIHHWI